MNTLRGHDISFGFDDRPLFKGVDLCVKTGERVALFGPSGIGKTNLLRVLCGLQQPWDGDVLLNHQSIYARAQDSKHTHGMTMWPTISMVFQDYQLFPIMTAWENCGFGLTKTSEVENRIMQYAHLLNVEHCMIRRPQHLSKGEQQRVAIIRALVRDPSFLLLDEPTGALDGAARIALQNLVHEESQKRGMAILFVTHDIGFARSLAARFLLLEDLQLKNWDDPMISI
jgi:ABC-type Fe3+/spermidine/putrescine transport system ATPase subunit